ncbi:hypothetical protein HY967_04795 [Candidatus Jorgensenbacteria bacterium]|nr:hypothetical protein [Candidatus Jorgensenbacteria bacterium]
MGFIIQMQRRAIESFRGRIRTAWPADKFRRGKFDFSLVGERSPVVHGMQPLVCLGISEGIGTCSDIKGMSVAVLGYKWHGENDKEYKDQGRLSKCAYAVLLWPYSILPLEREEKIKKYDPLEPKSVVELISFVRFEEWRDLANRLHTSFYFERTGIIKPYINM